MKTLNHIPTSKISRATKLAQVGAQVGVNYIKYLGDSIIGTSEEAKGKLDGANASAIYDGLSKLKGSALKMLQMMSMDNQLLPDVYVEKFSLSQFSVPPISGPLVRKVFIKYFGTTPENIFDQFNYEATHAASIGQVHEAVFEGQKVAVKIQYPGVSDSIESDLNIVKPIATKMFNLKGNDVALMFDEVKLKLQEETDYELELSQANEFKQFFKNDSDLIFPTYFPKVSNHKILTMSWIDGVHLSEFIRDSSNDKYFNQISQQLWDFYMKQFHDLKSFHADPHPGNFLVANNQLAILDFGCVKKIPNHFYNAFSKLMLKETMDDEVLLVSYLSDLEIYHPNDTEADKRVVTSVFKDLLTILAKPFHYSNFDFGDASYFNELASKGEELFKNKSIRKLNGNRGSKHFIYVNRTFFGLYSLLNKLNGGAIKTQKL